MKLLWQQVLGVMAVLMVALGLSAYLLSNYMSTQIYNNKQNELIQYGQNIVANQFTRNDLIKSTQLFERKGIVIQVYLADGTIIYPTYDQRNKLKLSKEQLEKITRGDTIGIQRSERFNRDGQLVEMATVYVSNEGGYSEFPQGFVSIGAPLADLDEQVKAAQDQIKLGFLISSGIGVIMALIYSMYLTKRIKNLQQATIQIASGHYDIQLDPHDRDELGDLARDFQKMAQALMKSEEEIKRQEVLRRQMMMDAAHEMRTPLTTMAGVLEGLKYDMIPEEQKTRSLELVMTETNRLTRLVNENLDYEKIRSQQIILKKQFLNVKNLFEQIAQQLASKADEKNNFFTIEAPEDLWVYADRDRLLQVLINIATNAVQFSQESQIELIGKKFEGGTTLKIRDYGIGIDKKDIENIWERFYKADISRKNTKFGESGIGLSVVKSLVEAHNGKINVNSQVGQGTEFELIFFDH